MKVPCLSLDQAASLLHTDTDRINALIRQGDLHVRYVRGVRVIPITSVEFYLMYNHPKPTSQIVKPLAFLRRQN